MTGVTVPIHIIAVEKNEPFATGVWQLTGEAAEIIDLFEERGIVGPPSGSGNKREILVFDEAEFAG